MVTHTDSLQELMIDRYSRLTDGGSDTWNVNQETPFIETRHFMLRQFAIPRDDDADVVRATLNIDTGQDCRPSSLDARRHT
jgi:hypothetical protein